MVRSLRRRGFKMGRLRGSKSHLTSIKFCPLARYSDSFFAETHQGGPFQTRVGVKVVSGNAAWLRPQHHGINVFRLLLLCWHRSMKKDSKLKEKKSKAWKQRQGEQKQAQAKKQKRYAAVQLGVFLVHVCQSVTFPPSALARSSQGCGTSPSAALTSKHCTLMHTHTGRAALLSRSLMLRITLMCLQEAGQSAG